MVDGQYVEAVFGFCDIRNFTDVTDVLQDHVMVFVNQISEIVHSVAATHLGSPNKNVGDAFLLVWRLGETTKSRVRAAALNQEARRYSDRQLYRGDADDDSLLTICDKRRVQRISELSIMSFVRIVAALNRSPVLAIYRLHAGLTARLPNYRVMIGFGLHRGWALEGAIGSELKIDASYLSPNVNLSAQLEAATKIYGVTMLMTGMLVQNCRPTFQALLRKLDRVVVAGAKDPFFLYTMDCDPIAVRIHTPPMWFVAKNLEFLRNQPVPAPGTSNIARRYAAPPSISHSKSHRITSFTAQMVSTNADRARRAKREKVRTDMLRPGFNTVQALQLDTDVADMTKGFSREFTCRFGMAVMDYLAGEWGTASKDSPNFVSWFCFITHDGIRVPW